MTSCPSTLLYAATHACTYPCGTFSSVLHSQYGVTQWHLVTIVPYTSILMSMLGDMLPIWTTLGHMWTTGENCIFLSVTVFAQLKLKVEHLQANFRIFAQKSSRKRWNFTTQKDHTTHYIFVSNFFRHETFPNTILGILIERIGWIWFR